MKVTIEITQPQLLTALAIIGAAIIKNPILHKDHRDAVIPLIKTLWENGFDDIEKERIRASRLNFIRDLGL